MSEAPLTNMLYRAHGGGDSEDLAVAAKGWLDALHVFGVDALAAGVPVSEVMPAIVQMLEGWMLARDAAALMTSWAALDATVTLLERRLAAVRTERERAVEERDRLRGLVEELLAERRARRRRRRRRRRR